MTAAAAAAAAIVIVVVFVGVAIVVVVGGNFNGARPARLEEVHKGGLARVLHRAAVKHPAGGSVALAIVRRDRVPGSTSERGQQ